jgi:hypothetical protein
LEEDPPEVDAGDFDDEEDDAELSVLADELSDLDALSDFDDLSDLDDPSDFDAPSDFAEAPPSFPSLLSFFENPSLLLPA